MNRATIEYATYELAEELHRDFTPDYRQHRSAIEARWGLSLTDEIWQDAIERAIAIDEGD